MVERSDTTGDNRIVCFASWRDASFSHQRRIVAQFAANPPGSNVVDGPFSGGVAALNHRLIAIIPSGWKHLCKNVGGGVPDLRFCSAEPQWLTPRRKAREGQRHFVGRCNGWKGLFVIERYRLNSRGRGRVDHDVTVIFVEYLFRRIRDCGVQGNLSDSATFRNGS